MIDETKFNTCCFRSKEKHVNTKTWCCGSSTFEGFLCLNPKVLLDDIKPEICEACIFYKSEDFNEDEESKSIS